MILAESVPSVVSLESVAWLQQDALVPLVLGVPEAVLCGDPLLCHTAHLPCCPAGLLYCCPAVVEKTFIIRRLESYLQPKQSFLLPLLKVWTTYILKILKTRTP